MEIYESDSEQMMALKEFVTRYKKLIIVSLTAGIIIIAGGSYWQHHRQVRAAQASDLYQQMLFADYKQDSQTLKVSGEALLKNYRSTPYAQWAALLLAKNELVEKRYEEARAYLQPISDKNYIAKLHLAKIARELGQIAEALKILEVNNLPNAYVSVYAETRGDFYNEQGEKEKAKEEYLKAMSNLPSGAQSALLQIKIMNLGLGEDNA